MSELSTWFCESCGWLGSIAEAEVVPFDGGQEEYVQCPNCHKETDWRSDEWPPEPWSLEGRLLAERRARQEAEAQAAVMRSALGLTVEAYQGVGDFEGTGQNMAGIIGFIEDALSTDTGKQYLAIVEAARRWEAAWDALGTHREPCQASRKYLCPTCSELSQAASEADNELIKAVLALKGGDSQ